MSYYISSNLGSIEIGPIYIGWNNHPYPPASEMDCGDETFGIGLANFYVGHYNGTGWCAGFLNEYGCLK